MEPNNTQQTKKGRGATISIIIIIIIIALVAFAMPKKSETPATPAAGDTTTNTDGTTTTNGTKATTTTTTTLSRKDAQELYQDRLIRITDQCLPDKMTVSATLQKGEKLMLDNDGTKAHTVVFAGATYQISAQGYRTVTLPTDGIVSHTCDQKTGTTTVVVAAK